MRRLVRTTLKLAGYRLVHRTRDPVTALDVIFAHPIDAVIDVGANTGGTCVEWLRRFPTAPVFAFEPIPSLAKTIRERTAPNASRIEVYQIAASDRTGEVEFNVHTDHPSSSSLLAATVESTRMLPYTGKTHKIKVQTDTLDSVLESKSFSEAFLKLDVQGHELSVLAGAHTVLRSVRFIQVEINLQPMYENQPRFDDISRLLATHGFQFFGVAEQFHLSNSRPVFLDALFERSAQL